MLLSNFLVTVMVILSVLGLWGARKHFVRLIARRALSVAFQDLQGRVQVREKDLKALSDNWERKKRFLIFLYVLGAGAMLYVLFIFQSGPTWPQRAAIIALMGAWFVLSSGILAYSELERHYDQAIVKGSLEPPAGIDARPLTVLPDD